MTDSNDRSNNDEDQVAMAMRRHAITTLRYKVYIFIMVVILVFFRPILTTAVDKVRGEWATSEIFSLGNIMSFWSNILHAKGEWGLLNDIDLKQEEIDEVQHDIDKAKTTNEVIEKLNDRGKQNTIINCLNNGFCDDIDEELLPFLGLFRTYLLIGNLKGTKMTFDQKTILKNINDFLLKTTAWLDNGELLSITFADPRVVDEKFKLHELPIKLSIEFEHQKMLLSFLHNVEEKVSFTIPILYKIDAIDYNIVDYAERQTVDISLLAYYIDGLEEEPSEQEVSWEEVLWGDTVPE